MWIVFTVIVGLVGGSCARKLKIPGGMLIGSLVAVTMLNVLTDKAFLWQETKVLAQILAGAYAGCMVEREDIRNLPKLIRPYLFILGNFVIINFVMGAVIYHLTDMDLLTSLFCALPGGVTDAPLIAMDMGADGVSVASMQVVRMLFGIGCLPPIIVWFTGAKRGKGDAEKERQLKARKAAQKEASLRHFFPTLLVAIAAGLIGRWSGFPAGTMTFTMVVVAFLKYHGKVPPMPTRLHYLTQLITGCCVGATLTLERLYQMRQLALPALLLCLAYLLYCIVGGILMHRFFRMDQRIAMLALSPAGALEMALIAADLGIESADLIVLQICRFVGVLLVMPQLYVLAMHLIA